jgi:non-canonical (house-cleaning) NTP pyrophosphatase
MRIAVGSSRTTHVEAVKEAWTIFSSNILSDPEEPTDYLGYDVRTGVPEVPLSVKELMDGAQNRVENLVLQLKRERAEADFYVGLASGFSMVDSRGPRRLAFLETWAFVSDGHKGHFGHGGGVPVPAGIADPVIDRGIELGIVADRFRQENDLRTGQGPWGILTKDILTQQHSSVIALIAAFAPFYNPAAYL